MSPAESTTKFDPQEVGVITTIWCGEAIDKMSDRLGPLVQLGFTKIALFGHLAWKFSDEFLPHYSLDKPSKVIEQAANIGAAFKLLADDESREIFVNHIEWRLFVDYDLLPSPSREEIYFNKKYINKLDAEVLYDIGAYTGDSVRSFLATERGNDFSQIHAFEPSPRNFLALKQYISTLGTLKNKVFAHQLAVGDTNGVIQVETEHGPASRVGKGSETVPVTTIDDFSKSTAPPTFIKIDIEGFEPNCLRGASKTISDIAPAIAVCVYHLQSHIWDILLQLNSYYGEYNFRLCPHLADGWDLVLYAVPKNRVPS
jgi:FkbM family methyltransferase